MTKTMGEVTIDTLAYSKLILHAAKYPYCAVNGVLLADGSKVKNGSKIQSLGIVDSIPLFHHSHYLSPMAEVALTQIETIAQSQNKVIAGFYAGCENFYDSTVEKCPGLKIAEKIAEYFPSAIFLVIDNKRFMKHLDTPALKLYKNIDGKWKLRDSSEIVLESPNTLSVVSYLLQTDVNKDIVDFDNYLDDLTQDWTNGAIEKLLVAFPAELEG